MTRRCLIGYVDLQQKPNPWGRLGCDQKTVSIIHASTAVNLNASQSSLGNMLRRNAELYSISFRCNSASLKCKGNDADESLQALTAQVTKFTVRIFITYCYCRFGEEHGRKLASEKEMAVVGKLR